MDHRAEDPEALAVAHDPLSDGRRIVPVLVVGQELDRQGVVAERADDRGAGLVGDADLVEEGPARGRGLEDHPVNLRVGRANDVPRARGRDREGELLRPGGDRHVVLVRRIRNVARAGVLVAIAEAVDARGGAARSRGRGRGPGVGDRGRAVDPRVLEGRAPVPALHFRPAVGEVGATLVLRHVVAVRVVLS